MIKEEIITDEKTVKELKHLQRLWDIDNPNDRELKEFENLCLKYWYIDSFEIIN